MTRLLVEVTAIVEVGEINAAEEALFVRDSTLDFARGIVEWSEVHATRIVTPADAVCDFCSLEEPVFIYDADDFVIRTDLVPGVTEASSSAWTACGPCSALIEVNDYRGLTRRSIERFRAVHGHAPREIESMLTDLHRGFRANRVGERRPLTEPENGRRS